MSEQNRTVRGQELLKHILTGPELVDIAKKQAHKLQELESLEDALNSVKADFKSQITRVDQDINDARRRIIDGYEMRSTDVQTVFHDPIQGTKTTYRIDTGEIVRHQRMSPGECQEVLPLVVTEVAEEQADAKPGASQETDSESPAEEAQTDPTDEAAEPQEAAADSEESTAGGNFATILEVNKPSYGVVISNATFEAPIALDVAVRLLDQAQPIRSVEGTIQDSEKQVLEIALRSIIDDCRARNADTDIDPTLRRAVAGLASWAIENLRKVLA